MRLLRSQKLDKESLGASSVDGRQRVRRAWSFTSRRAEEGGAAGEYDGEAWGVSAGGGLYREVERGYRGGAQDAW